MAESKLFPYPTVKTVIFQIVFPNLFFLESKIGDFQVLIMGEFPISSLLIEQQFVIARSTTGASDIEIKEQDIPGVKKIWQFKSNSGYELKLTTNTLSITSNLHKTYDNNTAEHRFRDVIKLAIDSFLSISKIPTVNRIGLRYIDECPLPSPLDNGTYAKWYNTALPTRRFDVAEIGVMQVMTKTRQGQHWLTFAEKLAKSDSGEVSLTLDFDGFSTEIEAATYLTVCDELHSMIAAEFRKSIRKPVVDFMSRKKEG